MLASVSNTSTRVRRPFRRSLRYRTLPSERLPFFQSSRISSGLPSARSDEARTRWGNASLWTRVGSERMAIRACNGRSTDRLDLVRTRAGGYPRTVLGGSEPITRGDSQPARGADASRTSVRVRLLAYLEFSEDVTPRSAGRPAEGRPRNCQAPPCTFPLGRSAGSATARGLGAMANAMVSSGSRRRSRLRIRPR